MTQGPAFHFGNLRPGDVLVNSRSPGEAIVCVRSELDDRERRTDSIKITWLILKNGSVVSDCYAYGSPLGVWYVLR